MESQNQKQASNLLQIKHLNPKDLQNRNGKNILRKERPKPRSSAESMTCTAEFKTRRSSRLVSFEALITLGNMCTLCTWTRSWQTQRLYRQTTSFSDLFIELPYLPLLSGQYIHISVQAIQHPLWIGSWLSHLHYIIWSANTCRTSWWRITELWCDSFTFTLLHQMGYLGAKSSAGWPHIFPKKHTGPWCCLPAQLCRTIWRGSFVSYAVANCLWRKRFQSMISQFFWNVVL